MKNLHIILLVLLFTTVFFNLQSRTNYEIYTVDNAKIYCPSPDGKSLYLIEKIEKVNTLVKRDLTTGEIQKVFKLELPKGELGSLAISQTEKTAYLTTLKEVEGSRLPQIDKIYSIKLKKGTVKSLLKSVPEISFLTKFVKMEDKLFLLSFNRSSFLLDIKKKKLSPIIEGKEFMLLFPAVEKNGAIFGKMGDSEEFIDLYFCDFSKKMKLTPIGKFQPDLRISTNEEDNEVPYFIIENKDYEWVTDSYNRNRYPSMVMMLADNKLVMDSYSKLNNLHEIGTLSLIDDTWLIGNRYSSNSLAVFNIADPKLTKTPTVFEEDIVGIDQLLNSKRTIGGSALTIENLDQVFTANFYLLKFSTQEVDYESSTSFLAYKQAGVYTILEDKEMLLPLLNKDFVFNETTAVQFENVLDLLFPLGTFEIDDKENYKKDSRWFFIRNESFGDISGVVVDFDEQGKILKITEEFEIK